MRRLTILFFTSFLVLPLFGQSPDRIELNRDIEYYRNTKPDLPLPDVYMPMEYPLLLTQEEEMPVPVLRSPSLPRSVNAEEPVLALSEEKKEEVRLPRDKPFLILPVPGIPAYAGDQKLSDLYLSLSSSSGIGIAGDYCFTNVPISLSLESGYDWGNNFLDRISLGGRYENHFSFQVQGGYNFQGSGTTFGFSTLSDDWAVGEALLPQNFSILLQRNSEDNPYIRSGFRSAVSIPGSDWNPVAAIDADGLFHSSLEEFRLSPSVGVERKGLLSNGKIWRAGGEAMLQYDSQDQSFSFLPSAFFFLVTPGDQSFFITVDRKDIDKETRMRLGLLEEQREGLMRFTGWQDCGIGLSQKSVSWEYYGKSGFLWGTFLREDGEHYRAVSDKGAYGDLQIRYKKSSFPVTDISFHAEYLSKQDLQYRVENIWFFAENLWSLGIQAGHYDPVDEKLSSLVGKEKFLYGLFAEVKAKNQRRIRVFLHYTPDEELLDGGVSLRLAY